MANMNKVILIGNLTRDLEMRQTPSGSAVGTFGLAVNRTYTKDGEKVENTDFFNIVVWTKLAELCAEYISKGSPIALEGRLQSRSWETEDGAKRSVVEVVANDVQFLGQRQDRQEQPQEPAQEVDLGEDCPF